MNRRAEGLEEGWYLMSTSDLELELARRRSPEEAQEPSNALRLSRDEALAYRNAGNLPDELDRSLRLVLEVSDEDDLKNLHVKRARYEPDYHEAPSWRRPGSRPVNVVPLRAPQVRGRSRPWWEDPEAGALEEEWQRSGTMAGIPVPGEYRGFVLKTVIALRSLGAPVTAETVANSIERWVPSQEADRIRSALRAGS
jgi:hypothetical protein